MHRILLAEDSIEDGLLFRHSLSKFSKENNLVIVPDGEQAIHLLTRYISCGEVLPSLLVVDGSMPHKNGFDVLRWVAEKPEVASIPAVMFSSSTSEEDAKLAYLLGARGYFIKSGLLEKRHEAIQAMLALAGLNLSLLPNPPNPGFRLEWPPCGKS